MFSSGGGNRAMASKPAPPVPQKSPFWSCLSCRILSGAALIGSGIYVYLGPRKVMQQRIPPSMWHITQISFAVGLVCWGVVIITDPVGKQKRKEE